ncbi:MAG TPA: complex I NDUFA9 subunit family protein [Betaproteobacteria bacterium]|nr:complex I NDUFA9 subunit family protein [Betaproteobacteria bacterium]
MAISHVCVLGGGGFVGRRLVSRLHAAGIPVRVLTRRRESARALWLLPSVTVVESDIHDRAALERQFAGMDAVINLVGILHERKTGDFHRTHVALVHKIVAACRTAGVRRYLHMSALQASLDAPSAYLRSKGEGEAAALAAEGGALHVTVFRPSVIFGPGDAFLNVFSRLLKRLPVLPLACPDAKFQPVFVGDVARIFTASLRHSATWGQRYNVCGPRVYTLRQLVALVSTMSGRRRRIIGLNPSLSYLQAWMMEWLPSPLMTRDNYLSMNVDNVCDGPFPAVFGLTPAAVETEAPAYLAATVERSG